MILGEYEREHSGQCNQFDVMVSVSLFGSQFYFWFSPADDSDHRHIKNLHRILWSQVNMKEDI